jgi:hypothetical protein
MRAVSSRTSAVLLPERRVLAGVVAALVTLHLGASQAAAQDALGEPVDAELEESPSRPSLSRVGWRGALEDSFRLLVIEHTWRVMFQVKTRRELAGPFLRDYVQSVRWPRQWDDGDSPLINYVGHPIHGAAAGRIWLDHSVSDRDLPLGMSRAYWASRARAVAWAASYSVQFEVGLLSEASIGNVGRRPEHAGWVDHVVTPAGALALTVAEDALDRYFVEWIERRSSNRALTLAVRVLLNPGRSLANVSQGRLPWFRFTRPMPSPRAIEALAGVH